MMVAESWKRRAGASLLLAGLPAAVLAGGALCADTAFGVLLVFGEPLLLAAGLYLIVLNVWNRRLLTAMALGLAVAVGGYAIHEPTSRHTPLGSGPQWLRELRGCTILPKPVTSPVRILTWTVDDSVPVDDAIDQLLAYRPDIVILYGTDSSSLGDKISAELDGEAKFFRGGQDAGGIMAVVRGSFQYCGGTEDTWQSDLPAARPGDAQVLLGFPHITDIGVVPLMMARLDTSTGPLDWHSWSTRIVEGATQTGEFAQTLGTRRLILAGNFQVPAQAQAMALPLVSSGLTVARSGPNWPNHVTGIPFLPQHALDQVWVGRDWHVQATRVLEAGQQRRAPIMVDLIPNNRQAR